MTSSRARHMADSVAAGVEPVLAPARVPSARRARYAEAVANAVGARIPEERSRGRGCDVGLWAGGATAGAKAMLTLTGGAMRHRLPLSVGAASPRRPPVIKSRPTASDMYSCSPSGRWRGQGAHDDHLQQQLVPHPKWSCSASRDAGRRRSTARLSRPDLSFASLARAGRRAVAVSRRDFTGLRARPRRARTTS